MCDRKIHSPLHPPCQQMQDAGAPPEEVVGEMPEGLENIPGLGGGAGGPGGEDCVVM